MTLTATPAAVPQPGKGLIFVCVCVCLRKDQNLTTQPYLSCRHVSCTLTLQSLFNVELANE